MHIAQALSEPDVGCVTGRVTWLADDDPSRADSENLYWRFEHALWARESRLSVLAWASGCCIGVRRSLFVPIEARYGDDVVIPLDVINQGYRVIFDPALAVADASTIGSAAALRARARMTLRSLGGTLSRCRVFSPLRRPGLFLAVISHKLLRWAAPMIFLITLTAASALALAGQRSAMLFAAAGIAALMAACGAHLTERFRLQIPLAAGVNALAVEHLGILIGVAQAAAGKSRVSYDPPDNRPANRRATLDRA